VGGLAAFAQEPPVAKLLASLRVPEGFTVELAATARGATYASLDEQGRLVVTEFSTRSEGKETLVGARIRMLEDTNHDGRFDRATVFADIPDAPTPIACHQNGVLAVLRSELVRLSDTDGDGKADHRRILAPAGTSTSLIPVFIPAAGPRLGSDGWLYLPGRSPRDSGLHSGIAGMSIWRLRPDGTLPERFASGAVAGSSRVALRASGELVGIGVMFSGRESGLRSALVHIVEGGRYEIQSARAGTHYYFEQPFPTMSEFSDSAAYGLVMLRGAAFGGESRGNFFTTHVKPGATGSVRRHVLARTGATFTAQESEFVTSLDPAFWPTDILEDTDGSLLVVNTGTNGAIFRVRRSVAPRMDDPRGEFLRSVAPKLSVGALVNSFQDPRPFVRDLAARLVRERVSAARSASAAIPELTRLRERSADVEARCMAVQHLARFGAVDPVAAALTDEHEDVRVAAARSLADARRTGHAVPSNAFARLLDALRAGTPAVRRESATTLGTLGNPAAGPVLLAAASAPADAFEDHAIVHALVRLGDRPLLDGALDSTDERVRTAARRALHLLDHK